MEEALDLSSDRILNNNNLLVTSLSRRKDIQILQGLLSSLKNVFHIHIKLASVCFAVHMVVPVAVTVIIT